MKIILTRPQYRQNVEDIGYTLLIKQLGGRLGKEKRPLRRPYKEQYVETSLRGCPSLKRMS